MTNQHQTSQSEHDIPYFVYLALAAAAFWICGMSIYFGEHVMPSYEGANWSTVQTLAAADGIELEDSGFIANINTIGYLTPKGHLYGIGREPRFFDKPGLDWIIFLIFLIPALLKLPKAIRS